MEAANFCTIDTTILMNDTVSCPLRTHIVKADRRVVAFMRRIDGDVSVQIV